MAKNKHIKVNLGQPAQAPALPPIPDLIMNFSDGTKIYTLRIPSAEMGKVAQLVCELMKMKGINHSLEEKPR